MAWFDLDRTLTEMEAFRRRMDDLFEALEGGRGGYGMPGGAMGEPFMGWGSFPMSELRDEGANLVVEADVPGLMPNDIHLECTAQGVTIRGERNVQPPEGYQVHRQERGNYRFSRSFNLPVTIDADKVNAEVRHGVLTVTLPKSAEVQPRRINVQS